MRICIVTDELAPLTPYVGGIGRAMGGLVPELAAAGHDVHVIVPGLRSCAEGVLPGVSIHSVGLRRRALGRVATTVGVDRLINELGPFSVVFAPEWGGRTALYALRKSAGPLITSLHSSVRQIRLMTPDARWIGALRPERVVQELQERLQTERSTAIVACSTAILDWTRRLWRIRAIPTEVIPNGIDIPWVRRLALGPPPGNYPEQRPVVSFSGRIDGVKGVVVLVKAMHRVWSRWSNARLVLAGRDGLWRRRRMSAYLRELAGPHGEKLILLGEQPPERLFPVLAQSDIVALPSLWENLSLAGLEAIALGRPLVATRGTGFDDIIEHRVSGLLVRPGDTAGLAEALTELLANEQLRQRLGAEARARSTRFSLTAVAARHAEFFDMVARGR